MFKVGDTVIALRSDGSAHPAGYRVGHKYTVIDVHESQGVVISLSTRSATGQLNGWLAKFFKVAPKSNRKLPEWF